jgi:hypothetical protein
MEKYNHIPFEKAAKSLEEKTTMNKMGLMICHIFNNTNKNIQKPLVLKFYSHQ